MSKNTDLNTRLDWIETDLTDRKKQDCQFDFNLSRILNAEITKSINYNRVLGHDYKGEKPTPNEVIIRNYEECMKKAQQYNNQK